MKKGFRKKGQEFIQKSRLGQKPEPANNFFPVLYFFRCRCAGFGFPGFIGSCRGFPFPKS